MKLIHKLVIETMVALVVLTAIAAMGVKPAVQPVQVTLIGAAARPEIQATVYCAPWCEPCHVYVGGTKKHNAGILDKMPADGWVLKDRGDKDEATAHILIVKDTSDREVRKLELETFPTTIIRKLNGAGEYIELKDKRIKGRVSADDLARAINACAQAK